MITLKEKFTIAYDEAVTFSEQYENYEKIADDYAISFTDWVNVNAYKYPTNTTTKELLEIFKKQNGWN